MPVGERWANFVKSCRCVRSRPLVFVCLCFILGLLLSRTGSILPVGLAGLFLCGLAVFGVGYAGLEAHCFAWACCF